MEAPELLHGGCYRGGSRQFGMEKQGKAGEAFFVEDLLDFSNDDVDLCGGDGLGFETAADDSILTVIDSSSNSSSRCDPHFPGDAGCPSFSDGLSDGLSVPYDEIAELEWLSNIVEESFSSEDLQRLQLISGVAKPSSPASASRVTPGGVPAQGTPSAQSGAGLFRIETHVPGKARSKRSRPAPSTWSSRLLVLSPTSSSAMSTSILPNSNPLPRKCLKLGKNNESAGAADGAAVAAAAEEVFDGHKCLHCATDKTPQWRTGPMGPKTLCNACGVRYKSGRLVPEYRPAASPTFVPSKHSNSHRKVLELRRQKEVPPHGGAPFLHPSSIYDPAPPSVDDLLLHHSMGPDFRQLI